MRRRGRGQGSEIRDQRSGKSNNKSQWSILTLAFLCLKVLDD